MKTVSAKLSASAVVALAVVAGMAALHQVTQQQLLARADSIATSVEAVREVTAVRASIARAQRHEQEAIVATAHPDLMELRAASWSQAMKDTEAALRSLRGKVLAEEGAVRAIDAAFSGLQGYQAGFVETQQAVKKGLLGDASIADATMAEPRLRVEAADKAIAQLAQTLVQRSDEARAQMAATARTARIRSLALVAVFAAIGIAGSLLMRRAIMRPLDEAVRIARRVAGGDLSPFEARRQFDEFGQLLSALENMRSRLHELVAGVRRSVDSLATAATQIASGNMDLSNRTELQAASLQAAAASVQRVSDSIRTSADGAQAACESAEAMFEAARGDGERCAEVVDTMQCIREATQRIQQITVLIDGIAMQTHILGLNASVEASNAGERGRGFAVVASSVRELADSCRQAAADARRMVAQAESQADAGMTLAQQAGEGITALIGNARAVSDNVSSISRAAAEQRDAIGQIGASMSEIDGATQQNAALVEEAAAAAQSLKDQAHRLADSVSAFKLA